MFLTTVGRISLAWGHDLFECLCEYLDHSNIFVLFFAFFLILSQVVVEWLDVPVSTRTFVVSCPWSTCFFVFFPAVPLGAPPQV